HSPRSKESGWPGGVPVVPSETGGWQHVLRNGGGMKALIKEARTLFQQEKFATLSTLLAGGPYASLVTYAPTPSGHNALLLLSRLAIHTQNLLAELRAALLVTQPAALGEDPMVLARLCLMGRVELVLREAPEFRELADAFRARHAAEHLFAM